MKVNLEKSFKAPFQFADQKGLIIIYAIAFGLSLFSLVFNIITESIDTIEQIVPSKEHTLSLILFMAFGVLAIIFLIATLVGTFMILGYVVETIKMEIYDRQYIMVPWEGNFLRFFMNGLKLAVIFICYIVLMLVIIGIPAVLTFLSHQFMDISALNTILMIVTAIFAVILIALFSGISPMIFVNFASDCRIASGFALSKIFSKIKDNFLEYLLLLLIAFGLALALGVGMMVFGCLTLCIGFIFYPLASQFLYPIVVYNMFAQLYKD